MSPLGSVAVLAPQDDEEVCRLRTSGKVTPVCPCLCTQPVVVTCWDIPMHLIGCSNVGAMRTRGFARRKHYSPVASESKALRDLKVHIPEQVPRYRERVFARGLLLWLARLGGATRPPQPVTPLRAPDASIASLCTPHALCAQTVTTTGKPSWQARDLHRPMRHIDTVRMVRA